MRVLVERCCGARSVVFFGPTRKTDLFATTFSFGVTLLRTAFFTLERELVFTLFFAAAFVAFTGAFFFCGGADRGLEADERLAGAFFFTAVDFFAAAFLTVGFFEVFAVLRVADFLVAAFFAIVRVAVFLAAVVSFFFVAMIGVFRSSPSVMPVDGHVREKPRITGYSMHWHGMKQAGSGVEVPHRLGIACVDPWLSAWQLLGTVCCIRSTIAPDGTR